MSIRTRRRRPAVAPCIALLIGVALGWHSPAAVQTGVAAAAICGALISLCGRGRSRLPRSLLLLAVLCACGVLAAIDDRSGWEGRAMRCFPAVSAPIELELRGRVIGAPEATFENERVLVVRGRAEPPPPSRADELTVRLTVRASPPEPTRRLDALGPGDEIRVWCRLFRPRGLGNPGSDDPAASLAARGLDALGSVKSARLVERVGPPASTVRSAIGRIRRAARRRLDRTFGAHSERRALAGAMLLGDRSTLEPKTLRRLRAAGLVHLVAISGLHVGLLACVVVVLLERMRLPALARATLLVSFLLGFCQLVGLRPSVVRAALAVVVIVTGRLSGRRGDALNALAWIAAVLVASAPASLLDPGLQLTFLATAAILFAGARPVEGPRRSAGKGFVVSGLTVSSSAYLATAPVTAWHFGWVAPICLLTNLAALPLCAIILVSGYLAILAPDLPLLGAIAGAAARGSTGLLLSLARLATEIERGGFAVVRPHLASFGAYYGLGLAWIAGRSRLRPPARRTLALGFALCVLALHDGPPPPAPPEAIDVAVIDVGQGQSVALRGKSGRTVLVDSAGSVNPRFDPGARIVLPFLLHSSGRRIDLMILSHDHLDHAGGAGALVRELEIGELCLPPGFHRSRLLSRLAVAARKRGAALSLCEWGARFDVGKLSIRVLAPRRGDLSFGTNDRSVVVVAGSAPYRLLIPGDLELEGEAALVASPLPLRAEALVLPHHGSSSASSREFLSRVRPRHAIVSCGAGNRFGHPHPLVCARVRHARATLWRTDLDGMLRLEGRQGEWRVTSTRR